MLPIYIIINKNICQPWTTAVGNISKVRTIKTFAIGWFDGDTKGSHDANSQVTQISQGVC